MLRSFFTLNVNNREMGIVKKHRAGLLEQETKIITIKTVIRNSKNLKYYECLEIQLYNL